MATRQFIRRPRLSPPTAPEGEIDLEAPPELPRPVPPNVMTFVLPGAMVLMVGGFIVIGGMNPASLMMGAMMLMMTVGMLGSNRPGGPGKAQLAADRRDYLTYLRDVREGVVATRQRQRAASTWRHPDPSVLLSFAGGRRMWERRQQDDDFTEARIGRGDQELVTPLRAPETGPIHEVDPISAVGLARLVRTHGIVEGEPVAIRLGSFPVIELSGDIEAARDLVRAMVAQLTTFHGPDGLLVAAAVDATSRSRWEYLKWLPHALHPTQSDSLGPVRMVSTSLAEVDEWLADEVDTRVRFTPDAEVPDGPHLLVIVDGGQLDPGAQLDLLSARAGVTIVHIASTGRAGDPLSPYGQLPGIELVLSGGRVGVREDENVSWLGSPDALTLVEADAHARSLAPYRLGESRGSEAGAAAATDLEGMLGLPQLEDIDAEDVWRPRPLRDFLRVPIGAGPSGELVELDVKESAFGGMGPHGLVVGATGSGKSELLRTLVLALAATHGPDTLNLVLIDFKGGATFLGLSDLPHTAAVITNLQDDLSMVDRMFDALSGEMNRRQELLRDAGNLPNVREYEKARAAGAPLDPLPSLLIICDEFTELLTQKPDFAELFVAIGRLGRSLGIHLLLASQRLEEGRLRGLDSHLSYRIGLKTFSAAESRVVLGVPDAYELPPVPGVGYLKVDTSTMHRFKAAYVSGPYVPASPEGRPQGRGGTYARPVSFVASRVDLDLTPGVPEPVAAPVATTDGRTVLDVVVGRLQGRGHPAHEVWLPPLSQSPTMDRMLALNADPTRGLGDHREGVAGRLRVPVALVDLPYEQRRDLHILDFSGAAGHGLVIGGPQSGKSTTLRSIVAALALTHTAAEVQVYAVDLGGGSLSTIAGLPHVGGVATRASADVVRRLVAEVRGIVTEREVRFRELGVESMADYRARQRAGDPAVAGDPFGDVFLVIDGWGAFREQFEDIEMQISSLAAQSLSYGVHLLIAANRWQEVRPALKDSMGTRLELRLGDPVESEVDRKIAALVPVGAPGRGLSPAKKHLLVGLPRIDGVADASTLGAAFTDLALQVSQAWHGPRARPVRMLPDLVDLAELLAAQPVPAGHHLPVALAEADLGPVFIDADADPHFLYFADGESGKTTFLRSMATAVMARYASADVRMLLVDYRRTMLGHVPPEYLAGYAASADQLRAYLGDLVELLRARLPGPDVTAEQLRSRSWWTGPEVFMLIDDYDLVSAASDNPLVGIRDLLPQAKDIGLHVVLARRTAGASRGLYDPLIQTIRELGSPGFVGTGSRDEGALIGPARPDAAMPPGRGHLVTRRAGAQLVQMASDGSAV